MEKEYDLHIASAQAITLDLKELLNEEKLLRLHPHWRIDNLREEEQVHHVSITDHATEKKLELTLQLVFPEQHLQLLRIALGGYPIESIALVAEGEEVQARVRGHDIDKEVEQNLLLWLRGIQAYLQLYLKKSPAALLSRVLMNRMILQMNPSQRKICMMISKITAVELLVIVIIVIGYVLFVQ